MHSVLAPLRGRLIVSCQAYPAEPMRHPETMAQIAHSVVEGGAAAVRLQGIDDIRVSAATLTVPIIGLWKDGTDGVFITPTLTHAIAVASAGAQIVALDGTRRPRPDGLTLAETVAQLRESADVLIMADCGSLDDARAAQDAGVDILGTTLAGYSGERPSTVGPDLDFVDEVVAACSLPVIVEGRVHTIEQAREAMGRGAFAVCVGTAITHPRTLTRWFADAVKGAIRTDS